MDSFTVSYTTVAENARVEAGQPITNDWTNGTTVHQSADVEALVNEMKYPLVYGWSNGCVIA